MSGGLWGNRGNKPSLSDSDDDNSVPEVKQTRKSAKISAFLKQNKSNESSGVGSGGKPPRMRGMLRMTKSSSADAMSDGDRSIDDFMEFDDAPKKSRFSPSRLKRHKSADDSSSALSSDFLESSSKGGKVPFFRRNTDNSNIKKRGGSRSGISYDSEGSYDDDSAPEKRVPRGMKKKVGNFLRKPMGNNSDDGTTKGRPPLGSSAGTRSRSQSDGSLPPIPAKGVSFSDSSLRGASTHGEDSDYEPAVPTRRAEGKPSRERARYSVYHGQGTRAVKRKFRVRPYRAFPEPVHMTEEEIYADSLQTSKNADFVKSYLIPSVRHTKNMDIPDHIRVRWGTPNEDGRIGSLRVEVLGCVSLNRPKPDICVYAICGDAAFCTDVIQGYRSPMWPNTCKRTAVFPIHHAYAKLYVGVFDVRKRANKDNDVFCGRVVIDISNIRPDTEYDTTMPLRASAFVYDKRKRGVIRLRFSVHWFSERAAVLSYFKNVQTIDDKNPLVSGQPTIPCADPRAFRNVAFTVHGQDLPGKYSKIAFRATLRELNLYQINLRRTLLVCLLDVMFYENKVVSIYMFISAMYCVYCNSVSLVPAIWTGYILMQYLNNYRHYVQKTDFNFGYKPLTIMELAKSVCKGGRNTGTDPRRICMKPVEVEKWTKRRANVDSKFKNITADGEDEKIGLIDDGKDIRPLDHREFPFSQREAYPYFGVEDALAPGSTKGDTGRLHGRLSVYYTASPDAGESGGEARNEDEESDLNSDNDDETVMTESQMMGDDGFDMDSASDEDDEANLQGADFNYKRVAQAQRMQKGKTRLMQRVHLGPPQDSDTKGKKVPPQVTLKKMENLMYKISKNVSVEFVHSGPQYSNDGDICLDTGMTQPSKELKAKMAQKAKKAQADEYDKILGLTVSYTNPIQRIMSSFMGPVMRMMRVAVYMMRIAYNLSAWRDPILSFWLLVFLVALFLILLVFPWRAFFFLTSVATMGPQNLFLRKIIERRAREKEEKKRLEASDDNSAADKSDDGSGSNKGRGRAGKKDAKKSGMLKELFDNLDPNSRTPFSTTGTSVSGSKRMPTRAVVVPYTRLKKERFYNWPPDPTVSRATPAPIFDSMHDDDSMTLSAPDVAIEEFSQQPSPLRQRKPNQVVPERAFVPPQDIAF